jgi:hypothetical protein
MILHTSITPTVRLISNAATLKKLFFAQKSKTNAAVTAANKNTFADQSHGRNSQFQRIQSIQGA